MKNLFFLPMILLLTLMSSCSKDTISGSGDLTSEFRDVDYFTRVKSEGVFEVNITQETSQSVEIIANSNIMSYVRTRVINNELQLYLDDDYNYRNLNIQANISASSLNGIQNSGTGSIFVHDILQDGSFLIDNSGSGDILLDGTVLDLNIINEGSGNIFGFDFLVDNCYVKIIGSSDVEISCSSYLNVDIEGSGNVYYKGFPTIETSIEGSGNVIDSN